VDCHSRLEALTRFHGKPPALRGLSSQLKRMKKDKVGAGDGFQFTKSGGRLLRGGKCETFAGLANGLLINLLQGLQLTREDFNLLGLCSDCPFFFLKTFL